MPLNVSVMLQTIEEMCVLHCRTQAIDELHVSTQAIDELHVFDCVFTIKLSYLTHTCSICDADEL